MDLSEAFAKGGPVGVLADLGKKVAEKKLMEELIGDKDSSELNPSSPEAKINKMYKAGLSESFTLDSTVYAAKSRFFKETEFKLARDTVNQYAGSWLTKTFYYQPFFDQSYLRAVTHGSELQNLEQLAVFSHPVLTKQNRS